MKMHLFYLANLILNPLTSHWRQIVTDYGTIHELVERHPDIESDWFVYEDDVYNSDLYSIDICAADDGKEYAQLEFGLNPEGFDYKYDFGGGDIGIVHIGGTIPVNDAEAVGLELDPTSTYYRLWHIKYLK